MRATGAVVCAVVLRLCAGTVVVAQEPANAELGSISGVVVDKSTADPIIEAGVEVIGPGTRARTDLDGKYTVKVPAGTYEVRYFAPLYQGSRIQKVIVKPNETTKIDVALAPESEAAVEVVEVVAEAKKAAEATQLVQRKAAPVVTDNISAQEIQKSTDSNAGEILTRLPSVTIDKRDNFVFVRGLSERYSAALLNQSRLPSTDPDRRVIPLDAFPATFIDAIDTIKTYKADLPGDFAGGLVDITLREPPDRLTYSVGASLGVNTQSSLQNFESYEGSRADIFGLGASFRALPSVIPKTQIPTDTPAAQQRVYVASFRNIWDVDTITAPPNFGLNFSVGDTFGPLGVSLGGIWKNEYVRRPQEIANSFKNAQEIEVDAGSKFVYRHTIADTDLSGLLTADYELSPDHQFDLRALVDHSSDNEVFDGEGVDETLGPQQTLTQTVLYYVEEQLGYGQLTGAHHFSKFDVDWRSALSQTTQNAPDSRFYLYQIPADGPPVLFAQQENVLRTFSNLDEYLTDSAIDLTFPFGTWLPGTDLWSGLPAKFQTGLAYAYRDRDFTFRRFAFQSTNLPGDRSASPEVLLVPENIGTLFNFVEPSGGLDQFTASQQIAALYGMFDLPLIRDRLSLNAGVRLEYSYILLDSTSTAGAVRNFINDLDPLPGISLIYNPREDMKVIVAYSQTVSRPEFRELTPGQFPVPLGERQLIGNPFLVSTTIQNVDLRWDWYLASLELLSASFFYKDLGMPIEQIAIGQSASTADSFANANEATLFGFEFEVRKNLDLLAPVVSPRPYVGGVAPYLKNFRFIVNAAVIESTADLTDITFTNTSTSRALQGQAPFIINAAIEYDDPDVVSTRLVYNTVGRRISATGVDDLPDIFDERRDQLDFVANVPFTVFDTPLVGKFAVENILNDPFNETQGDQATSNYADGVIFTMGLSYSF